MKDFPESAIEPKRAGSSTAIIYVSLYFLLLAFFMYLHSISAPTEEKVKQVIGSIDFAFKGIEQKQKTIRATKLTGDELGLAVFHAELKKVYETAIPLIESKISKKGTELRFTLPATQLFASNIATLREARNELFEEAARILIKRSAVAPTDMEIMIDAGERLPSGRDFGADLATQRLNALINTFLEKGVPARHMFIGMKSGQTSDISFRFYTRNNHQSQFRKAEGAQ